MGLPCKKMIELVTISGERIYTISTEGSINPLPRSSTPQGASSTHSPHISIATQKDIANSIIYLQGSPILVAAGYFKAFNITMWCSLGVYVACMLFVFIFNLHTNLLSILIIQLITNISLLVARAYYIRKFKILR